MKPYPTCWPKPIPHKPRALATRISEEQKLKLYNREITTRDLAKLLDVHENYLSTLFPGKVTPISQQIEEGMHKKRAIRKVFRTLWARKVIKKEVSVADAANHTAVSKRTMQRIVRKLQSELEEQKPLSDESDVPEQVTS